MQNLTILVGRVNVPLTSLFKTERLIKNLVRIMMTVTKLLPEGRTQMGATAFSIMVLFIINDVQHNDTQHI
jgi:hypothetical protein